MKNATIKNTTRNNHTKSHAEELILSEFDIDFETMEEHLEELLFFMEHQDSVRKLQHDKIN